MKKKLLSLLLCITLTATMLIGCSSKGNTPTGNGTDNKGTSKDDTNKDDTNKDDAGNTEEDTATDVTTVGPDSGTHFELWSFVNQHNDYYAKMLNLWNEQNPDKQIQITFTTYPYGDMHTKLTLANQSGQGAPDICDVEISQFPNYLVGDVKFYPLNDVIKKYQDDIVKARLDIYSKDGNYYGIDFHVGATVMYYNTAIFEQYGIDYTKIKTWDDFTAAGKELKEASGGAVNMTTVDTGGTDWLWLAMAEHGEDYTTAEGAPNIELDSIKKMIKLQQGWLNDGIAVVSPGGQLDTEEGKGFIVEGKVAAFPKAMWFMSRFVGDMPEETGKWAIAPCPVFEAGQPRSVGIGGTGTIVSTQSKNPELAAEFLAYAKLSYEGNVAVWENLGFDTLNTTIWSDTKITGDKNNKYIAYFVTNPFDALNQIKDEIGKIKVGKINPAINEQFNLTILNDCFENGANVDDELAAAQEQLELEDYK